MDTPNVAVLTENEIEELAKEVFLSSDKYSAREAWIEAQFWVEERNRRRQTLAEGGVPNTPEYDPKEDTESVHPDLLKDDDDDGKED